MKAAEALGGWLALAMLVLIIWAALPNKAERQHYREITADLPLQR